MRGTTLISLAFLVVLPLAAQRPAPAPSAPAPAAATGQLSGASSYRLLPRSANCTAGYRVSNLRYTVVGSTLSEGNPPHLVLEERTTLAQCENLEGPSEAEVTVIARPALQPSARPVWQIQRRGDRGEVVDSFSNGALYRLTTYGCCGSEDLDEWFSLRSGTLLFRADHPLLTVDAEPFGSGMVAVVDANAASFSAGENDRTLIAVMRFGGDRSVGPAIQLRGPSSDFMLSKLELVARGPNGAVKRGQRMDINSELDARWSLDVALELEGMSEGGAKGRVEIPLSHGALHPEQARITGPFRVALAPR